MAEMTESSAKRLSEKILSFCAGLEEDELELLEAVVAAGAQDVGGFALRRISATSDDAQLANVDLQNILQKQQQTLQMMSNISKMLYDTSQSIIRKTRG